MLRAFLQAVALAGAAFLVLLAFSIATKLPHLDTVTHVSPEPQEILEATSTPTEVVEAAEVETAVKAETKPAESQPAAAAQSQETETGTEVYRVANPYSTSAKADADLYALGRAAIVNIYCQSRGSLSSAAGSGVVIDSRGIILTNAHVAQYMLLATDSRMNIECFIRTGSPSKNRYKADILYLPTAWIDEHADDIAAKRPKGTGEHDYALLLITKTVDDTPLPTSFPHLPIDTREAIAFSSDRVLLAGYPAEFSVKNTSGSSILYPASVFTKIGELLTFGERSVDLISLGGAVLAQSGSSGGAVINLWGYLVGIISTTSDGATTADRELRAITLAYINRDLQFETGVSLDSILDGNLQSQAENFMRTQAPALAAKLTSFLP